MTTEISTWLNAATDGCWLAIPCAMSPGSRLAGESPKRLWMSFSTARAKVQRTWC